MDNNELMEMMKRAQKMIDNNEIPKEIKMMAQNMSKAKASSNQQAKINGNVVSNSPINANSNISSNISANSSFANNTTSKLSGSNIDMNSVMNLLNTMNLNNDDDLTRLLFALKPYLRNERKEKVDEYVKLIKLGKIAEVFDKLNNTKK